MVWVKAFDSEELPDKKMKQFKFNDYDIVIYRDGDKIYAFENRCSHEDYPLVDGEIFEDVVECSKHGARFNIKTGEVLSMPACIPIKVYKCKIENNAVYVEVY